MDEIEFKLRGPLLQAIVNNLNNQPAGMVRGILNELDAVIAAAEAERAAAQREKLLAEAKSSEQ